MLFIGVNYGRGAQKNPIIDGCEKAPLKIQTIYKNHKWEMLSPTWEFDIEKLKADRFSENFEIQKIIYNHISNLSKDEIENHIFVGGDHSVNFAHFKAVKQFYPNEDIGLIYIDAHFDIHTPESSKKEASGSPHGTNVRHLLGYGDERYLSLGTNEIPLKKENLFFIGARSYEPSELQFVKSENIFTTNNSLVNNIDYLKDTVKTVLQKLNGKKYIISFDFDVLSTTDFTAVQVPEKNGIRFDFINEILPMLNTPKMICAEFVEYAPKFDILGDSETKVKKIINHFIK